MPAVVDKIRHDAAFEEGYDEAGSDDGPSWRYGRDEAIEGYKIEWEGYCKGVEAWLAEEYEAYFLLEMWCGHEANWERRHRRSSDWRVVKKYDELHEAVQYIELRPRGEYRVVKIASRRNGMDLEVVWPNTQDI